MVYSPKYHVGMKSFGLSCEDAQDKDGWRLRIKGATGSKMAVKMLYVCVQHDCTSETLGESSNYDTYMLGSLKLQLYNTIISYYK